MHVPDSVVDSSTPTISGAAHARRPRMAIEKRRPPAGLVSHSDRVSEYGGYRYRGRLAWRGIAERINRPQIMTDNAFVESVFHLMKVDVIHGNTQSTSEDLEIDVRRYIARYNLSRLHSAQGFLPPIDYERANARNLPSCVH